MSTEADHPLRKLATGVIPANPATPIETNEDSFEQPADAALINYKSKLESCVDEQNLKLVFLKERGVIDEFILAAEIINETGIAPDKDARVSVSRALDLITMAKIRSDARSEVDLLLTWGEVKEPNDTRSWNSVRCVVKSRDDGQYSISVNNIRVDPGDKSELRNVITSAVVNPQQVKAKLHSFEHAEHRGLVRQKIVLDIPSVGFMPH